MLIQSAAQQLSLLLFISVLDALKDFIEIVHTGDIAHIPHHTTTNSLHKNIAPGLHHLVLAGSFKVRRGVPDGVKIRTSNQRAVFAVFGVHVFGANGNCLIQLFPGCGHIGGVKGQRAHGRKIIAGVVKVKMKHGVDDVS